jgi:hypothetical protein
MPQQQNVLLTNREGQNQLALSAYYNRQFQSLQRAAEAFNTLRSTLTSRYNGISYRPAARNGRHEFTATEEQTIV